MKQMLKRDWALFRRGLAAALALAAVVLAVCAGAAFAVSRGSEELFTPVGVALVDEEDSLFSRITVNLVKGQEFISRLMDIEAVDEPEALEGMESGRYAAVIILPEGYIDGIMTGESFEARIVLSRGAAASAQVVESVSRLGSLLLASGQYGVFAGEELIREYGLDGQVHSEFLERSNLLLMDEALESYRGYFHIETLPYGGAGLSIAGYGAALWLCFALALCGVFFPELYNSDRAAPLRSRLRALGLRDWQFLSGKLLWPFVFRIVIAAAALTALGTLTEVSITPMSLVSALLACAYLTVLCTAAMTALPRSGAPAVITVSSICLVCCGGVIPRAMLPAALAAAGDASPLGCALGLMAPAFGGKLTAISVLAAGAYCALALWLCLLSLKRFPEEVAER